MSRRIFYGLALAALACLPAAAQQETPKVELFGGYAFAGDATHGWVASVTGNVNSWLGLTGEAGGQYSLVQAPGFEERIRVHSYLFGPQFSLRRHRRVTPFVRALFGASRISTRARELGLDFAFTDTAFSLALGGGLDVRINERFAVRAFQLDYLRTGFFDERQNKGRLSAGLVVRFGKR